MEKLPDDVIELVIAARKVAFGGLFDEALADPEAYTAMKRLDKASEAFADRVEWEDEPQENGREKQANAQGKLYWHSMIELADGPHELVQPVSDRDMAVILKALSTPPKAPVEGEPSRYHLNDPVSFVTTEGEVKLGKGWLLISEAEYASLNARQQPDEVAGIILPSPANRSEIDLGAVVNSCFAEIGDAEPFVVEKYDRFVSARIGTAKGACTQLSAWLATNKGHPVVVEFLQRVSSPFTRPTTAPGGHDAD